MAAPTARPRVASSHGRGGWVGIDDGGDGLSGGSGGNLRKKIVRLVGMMD